MEISGTVKNKQTGETIPGANVYISDSNGNLISPNVGVNTDSNGNYKLEYNLPTGTDQIYSIIAPMFNITASFVGFAKKTNYVSVSNKIINDFELSQSTDSSLPDIWITAKKPFPWLIAIAVLVAATGISYLIIDASKHFKKTK